MLLGVILCSIDKLLERMRLLRRGNTEVDGEADVHLAYTVDHRSDVWVDPDNVCTHTIANHESLELLSGYHGLVIGPDPYTDCDSGHHRCIAPSSEDRCHCVLEALRAMHQAVTLASRPQLWQVQGMVR